jgi:Rrf2 family protein
MRMSAKAEYAVRAMTQLAAEQPGILVKTDDLAKAQGIPAQFLVDILSALRADRLVRSQRGRDGGYELARPADQISIADVLRCIDGPLASVRDIGLGDLPYSGPTAALTDVWRALRASMRAVLEDTTLADVARGALPEHVSRMAGDYVGSAGERGVRGRRSPRHPRVGLWAQRVQRDGGGRSHIERVDTRTHGYSHDGISDTNGLSCQPVALRAQNERNAIRSLPREFRKTHRPFGESEGCNVKSKLVERVARCLPVGRARPGNGEHRAHGNANTPPIERIGAPGCDENRVRSHSCHRSKYCPDVGVVNDVLAYHNGSCVPQHLG